MNPGVHYGCPHRIQGARRGRRSPARRLTHQAAADLVPPAGRSCRTGQHRSVAAHNEAHVPRHVRGAGARQDRGDHGRDRRDRQLPRARAALGAAGPRAVRRRAAARRRSGAADREQPARLRGVLGRDAVRAVHHRGQQPPQAGRGGLHRQRQRRDRADRIGRVGRHRRGDHRPDERGQAPAGLRRTGSGPRQLRGDHRRRVGGALRRPAAGRHHAVLLGHHRPSQGRPAAAARAPGVRARRDPGDPGRAVLRRHAGFGLPVAGADLPRGPAALVRRHPGPRRHRGDDEAVRRRTGPGGHRGPARHARAVRADHVRPDAAAPARGPRPLRRKQPAGRDPRRGARARSRSSRR